MWRFFVVGKHYYSWNRHMATKLERGQLDEVTSYCHCGHCAKLPYVSLEREKFCCQDEFMSRPTKWNKNVTDILKAHKISCITEWDSFEEIVIKREVCVSICLNTLVMYLLPFYAMDKKIKNIIT